SYTHDPPAKLGVLVVATGCMRMQQPDGKQHATPPGGRDERLPPTWQRLLDLPKAPGGDEPVVLGFFLEVMPEEGAAWAHLEVAPVLLAVAEHGRYARPVPLDSRHLVQAPLPPHEQRLAAAVLGLPQTQRKGRSYARLGGHVGDSLLVELLDTAPCFLGGLAGLRLSRGKAHPLNWHWQLETDGSQRLLPNLPHSQRLLRIDGLWYLDAEHTTLGHLEAAPEETAWMDLPALKHEYGRRLAEMLPASRLAARIPPPQVFAELQRAELTPKPVLTMHALTRHGHVAAGLGAALLRLRGRTPARPRRRTAGAPRAQRPTDGDRATPRGRACHHGAARTHRPHARGGHRGPALGHGRHLARRRLAVPRHRPRRRAGGEYAGALDGAAAEARSGRLRAGVRAQLPVRGAGRPGALVRPSRRGCRRPRLRPGDRHRTGSQAPQPAARGGAGAGRAP